MAITDPEHLAEVLLTVVRKEGQSANALAKDCGMDQGQLSRLLNGKLKRVSILTYNRLCAIAQPEEEFAIRQLFLSDEARESRAALNQRLSDLSNSPEARVGVTEEERALLRQMAGEYPKVRRALIKLDRVIQKRGHDYGHKVAALREVLEPLNRFYTTLGMQRGFHELSRDELAAFLAHGIERERILLEREPDLVRAQNAAEQLPEVKARLKARTEHFGEGRPFCWDFEKPKFSEFVEGIFASHEVHYDAHGNAYVDTPPPLFQRRRRKRRTRGG